MHRDTLPISQLAIWAHLNAVQFHGVKIAPLDGNRGTGVLSTAETSTDYPLLMTVPVDLVLSLDNVWICAKSDMYLQELLVAVGEFSRVPDPFVTAKTSNFDTTN